MQTRKRPSARFHARSGDRSIRASATAGAVAGEKDVAELEDNDPGAAWLEHVDDGGVNTPEGQAAFESAYEEAYTRAYGRSDLGRDITPAAHAGE